MKSTNTNEDEGQNGVCISASTSMEEHYLERVERLAQKDQRSRAAIIRKCVIRALPELEREILGAAFVGGVKPKGNGNHRKGEKV